MLGTIRLGNLRASVPKSRKPKEGDTVVRFDRVNPILGNKHILYDAGNSEERAKVIALYKIDLNKDIQLKGPMFKAIEKLADKIIDGENIIGMCWCTPLPCHGSLIIEEVLKIVKNKLEQKQLQLHI